MGKKVDRRYLSLAVLGFGGAMIYTLPMLRFVLYTPLQEALGLDHEQFGLTMVAFGLCATLSFLPGGWLADRTSPRLMLSASYLATGLAGFWLAAFPPYWAAVLLHGFWGVTTSLTFWPSFAKATKDLAEPHEQGRFFGLVESGRGLFSAALNFFAVWLLARFVAPAFGLSVVIITMSVGSVAAAVLTWVVFRDPPRAAPAATRSPWADIGRTVRSPYVWGMTVIVFTACLARCLGSFMTPYLTEVMLLNVGTVGFLSTAWSYGCQFVAGQSGGFIADRIKSRAGVLSFGFLLMIFAFLCLRLTPAEPAFTAFIICLAMLLFFGVFIARGGSFAIMHDLGIPPETSGAAIGVASMIGFTPEMFAFAWAGGILDKYKALGRPAEGYVVLFDIGTATVAVGLLTALWLMWRIRVRRAAEIRPEAAAA